MYPISASLRDKLHNTFIRYTVMTEETRLEKIADDFIENYLRDNPVMIYSLDKQLEDYVQHTGGIEDKRDEISKEHYRKRGFDKDVDNELINAAEKILNGTTSDSYDNEMPDTTLIAQVESIEDPLIYQLTHLVLRSTRVRIRTMHELEEAELEDPVMPNKWVYHKDTPIKNVLNYILHEYEMFKNEDEMEIDDGT
jgi:hypothetical protein